MCEYVNPGSPSYLLSKAPQRPKPQYRAKTNVEKKHKKKTYNRNTGNSRGAQPNTGQEEKNNTKKTHIIHNEPLNNQGITDRERLSLEQFENRKH